MMVEDGAERDVINSNEFDEGRIDCIYGEAHSNKSVSYNQGYAYQYEMDQRLNDKDTSQEK